ncbi:imidazole glycerol phosphate synthase subunit HisH [Kozakia baliensis]|uniref:Imidazole glycerol phosphate synthase subunit HisH n=2 Tax=Kozakia baliensis TaxID=153496 RepID=A0A1D8USW2_9PROT|nr:imidazole glycerol phosphate synthase subunit HisH [Kozakia baliensis]AOX16706.1 imidazole glycerol phosphate synthase subunit HisH [Kozakia baliensis]GEL64820.1 imidazole glycerol phosphate synthase subunit HisH [Kozakia baliensis]
MKQIVVVDYNGGNLASAAQTARRVVSDLGLNAEVVISGDPATVKQADRVILPGQGAFAHCAEGLSSGLRAALEETTEKGTPFLGICVGMQLMAEWGLEHGRTPGFGWIEGEIAPMDEAASQHLRLPHMGWNNLNFVPGAHPLTAGLEPDAHGYFVHSYALHRWNPDDLVASADYGTTVPAIVAKRNRCGTQFHVEKSQRTGLQIMANFLRWQP